MNNHSEKVKSHYNRFSSQRNQWKNKNRYYHAEIERLCKFLIPAGQKVLEIGSGTGDLLHSLRPSYGVGLDISENMTKEAKKKYPSLKFYQCEAENIILKEKFDFIVLSDIIGNLSDVQKAFDELYKVSHEKSRIIITYYNYLWEFILILAEKIGLKMPQPTQNWLSQTDIENLLELANLDVVKKSTALLFPIKIPFVSNFINRHIAHLPIFNKLCLVQYFIVRQKPNLYSDKEYSVSVIIPARNEEKNIEKAVLEIPKLGIKTQLVFVEGHSIDNTKKEIQRVIEKYKDKKEIMLVNQENGIGKGDAVRKGIAKSTGQIVIIFDADLTVDPQDLPKFYHALRLKKGEYIQGSRLIYPMEKQAMQFLNILGNKFFSAAFSYLLDQPIKDTLCGTKTIFRDEYEKIAKSRSYFGDFDPFGDFDLLFGAAKHNLKIVEIPIGYKARTYGQTNISRFKHGWLLFKMTLIAAKKLKFL